MRIPDVATFQRLAAAGRCGNTPRIWPDLYHFAAIPRGAEDLCPDFAHSLFGFISSHRADNFRIYCANQMRAWALIDRARRARGILRHPSRPVSCHIDDLFVIESPDPQLQGSRECFQFDWVPSERFLLYAISSEPWGAVKRAGRTQIAEGSSAERILAHYLGDSREDLQDLDAVYPGAIIEATYFGFPFGIYARPLTIWEVRHY